MLKDDISVAPGIRQEKFERNVRKKVFNSTYSLSKYTFVYIYFTLHIFTDVNLLYIYLHKYWRYSCIIFTYAV